MNSSGNPLSKKRFLILLRSSALKTWILRLYPSANSFTFFSILGLVGAGNNKTGIWYPFLSKFSKVLWIVPSSSMGVGWSNTFHESTPWTDQ